ncbi:hypothetical protein D9M68_873840 [compost metagenome]
MADDEVTKKEHHPGRKVDYSGQQGVIERVFCFFCTRIFYFSLQTGNFSFNSAHLVFLAVKPVLYLLGGFQDLQFLTCGIVNLLPDRMDMLF